MLDFIMNKILKVYKFKNIIFDLNEFLFYNYLYKEDFTMLALKHCIYRQ